VATLILAPETRLCTTDYDLTVCHVGHLAAFTTGGVLLIITGAVLFLIAEAVAARRPNRDAGEAKDTR
jgi:hypothetical protein